MNMSSAQHMPVPRTAEPFRKAPWLEQVLTCDGSDTFCLLLIRSFEKSE